MKKLLFGLFSLTLLATACKKDKDAPAITKENLAGTYKMTAMEVSISGVPGSQDAFSELEACQKDDQYKLNLDNSFNYVDAGTACDPAGDYTSAWSLTGNQITIDEEVGTVSKFDGTILEVTSTASEGGMTMTIKSTFQKQ